MLRTLTSLIRAMLLCCRHVRRPGQARRCQRRKRRDGAVQSGIRGINATSSGRQPQKGNSCDATSPFANFAHNTTTSWAVTLVLCEMGLQNPSASEDISRGKLCSFGQAPGSTHNRQVMMTTCVWETSQQGALRHAFGPTLPTSTAHFPLPSLSSTCPAACREVPSTAAAQTAGACTAGHSVPHTVCTLYPGVSRASL